MKKQATIGGLIFQQNVLSLLLLTFLVAGIWVGFSIYFSYSKTTIGTTDSALIAPLNPKLDSNLFDTLAGRLTWSDQDLSSFTPSVVIVGGPTPLPGAKVSAPPIATNSASASTSAKLK